MTLKKFTNMAKDNFSYKVVALFIALILWATIEGRRDFVVTKQLEIEFIIGSNQSVLSQGVNEIKVKLAGPRVSLQKFVDNGLSQLVRVNLTRESDGSHEVRILPHQIEVPFGVRVLSIKPERFSVQLKTRSGP